MENLELVMQEFEKDTLNPELIVDNKLHFIHDNVTYRVRMPNQQELAQASRVRNRTFYTLLREKDENGNPIYLVSSKLKELLKEAQGIDIEAMEKELDVLKDKYIKTSLELSKCRDDDTRIDSIKDKIQKIKTERQKLIFLMSDHLALSIDVQARDAYYRYLVSICTERYFEEIKDEITVGNYCRVWPSIIDYEKDDTVLPGLAMMRFTELYMNV